MAGLLPHVAQVHRVDAVRDPARTAYVLPLHPRTGGALLLLARLIQRPHRHPVAAGTAGPLIPASHPVPPDQAHRRLLLPRSPAPAPPRPLPMPGPPRLPGRTPGPPPPPSA